MFINGLNMGWKLTDSSIKKKSLEQRLVNNVILIVNWNKKEPIPTDFVEKGATVNMFFIAYSLGKIHLIY